MNFIKSKHEGLEILLKVILNAYFSDSYCTNIITNNLKVSDLTIPTVSFHSNLQNNALKALLLEAWELGCSDYVVQTQKPKVLVDTLEDIIHEANQRTGERKIIFLPIEDLPNEINNGNLSVFNETPITFIPNVLLITKVLDEECEVYNLSTHKYTGKTGNKEQILLDQWSSCTGFKYVRNLFPHDMSNLQGKTVKVAAFEYKPYAFLNLDKSVSPEGYDGTEMRIVMEFCRWLNCTLKLVVDEKHEWGQIFDNRTGNGVLGAIAMDKADIGITALYSWHHEYMFLDVSMPAIRTGISCLVPSPLLVPGWKLAVVPFTTVTWATVGVTLVLMTLVLWFATSRQIDDVAFITFRLMIMQCAKEPVRKHLRVLIIWYFLAGMLLDASYSGSLASTLTVPKWFARNFSRRFVRCTANVLRLLKEEPGVGGWMRGETRLGFSIDTVEDLKNSTIEWGATDDAWIYSISSSTEPTMVHLVDKFRILTAEELRGREKSRKFAFSIERLPAGHYAVGDYITEDALPLLQLMHEDIYWEQCLMMARKSSPYTRKYNQLLSRLHSSGILLEWETQVALKYLNMNIQNGVKMSRKRHRFVETNRANITKVLGAFIILGIGYCISTAVWIVELLTIKIMPPKK